MGNHNGADSAPVAFGAVYMLQDDDDFEDVMSILGIF